MYISCCDFTDMRTLAASSNNFLTSSPEEDSMVVIDLEQLDPYARPRDQQRADRHAPPLCHEEQLLTETDRLN
jgi:hypothetical protein